MMTRSTDNVPSSSVSPAYIVFKDPANSLNDGKSVFAGHGAILIGIESMAFFEHLKELLEHEEPELARDICALPTTGFSPAMKVRLKGEANASQLVASFLGCEEYGARDAVGQRIGWSVRRLTELAEMIRAELQSGDLAQEIRKAMLQRHLRLLAECWTVVRDIALSETGLLFFTVPHSLSPLLNLIRHHAEQHLDALKECKQHQQATESLGSVFDFLLSGDPAERDVGGEFLPQNIQQFQTFIDRAMVMIGTSDNLVTDDEKAFFKRAAADAAEHATRMRKKNAEVQARIDALPLTKAAEAMGAPPPAQPAQPPTAADSSTRSAPAATVSSPSAGSSGSAAKHEKTKAASPGSEWRVVCSQLSLDDAGGRVKLGRTVLDFDGKTTQQFMLLALLSKRPNKWLETSSLEGADGPWSSGECTIDALGSCATKVRQALRSKGMDGLALAIKTRRVKGDPQVRFNWPPAGSAVD
jgi:hypothetical protein